MIEMAARVSELFAEFGYTWKLDNGTQIMPTENDVEQVIDKAAGMLYDRPVGSNVRIASLLIEKTDSGFDVYVLAGTTK